MSAVKRSVLHFVACASRVDVLQRRLLASACVRNGANALTVHFNCASAAQGFNATMMSCTLAEPRPQWLVWVHQDVFLPTGWERQFLPALAQAQQAFDRLAVVGVYGVVGAGSSALRAGQVRDRGVDLREATPLPCLVDSLDELLFAVRVDSGLRLDPALGFDFYGTDIVLQAQAAGLQCAVVHAPCEHWSDTPAQGAVAPATVARIKHSAAVFERKWATHLPITTPCFAIAQVGDTATFIDSIVARS